MPPISGAPACGLRPGRGSGPATPAVAAAREAWGAREATHPGGIKSAEKEKAKQEKAKEKAGAEVDVTVMVKVNEKVRLCDEGTGEGNGKSQGEGEAEVVVVEEIEGTVAEGEEAVVEEPAPEEVITDLIKCNEMKFEISLNW
mgnify:CR=1 FL=1